MAESEFRYLLPRLEGAEFLAELALDTRWYWIHSADELWKLIDPETWALTRNPWLVLQATSEKRLKALAADPKVLKMGRAILDAYKAVLAAPAWFQTAHPKAPLGAVAYFCMEFMLTEALPIYSGGLGNVAGDQLKAASDLGVPVSGVGLLYQQGYFRQVLDRDGGQRALYPHNDPVQMPVVPVRTTDGEWLRLSIDLPGRPLWLRTWEVCVGRARLYLLDSNDPANLPADRGITSELYGGGPELRLQQEMVLGIGGWRLLRALGVEPAVCHLNEGHAAFAVLERARDFMRATGQPFDVALTVTRAGNLFTTHTAVPAGFDRFDPALLRTYLARYADDLGIGIDALLALGRDNPADPAEPFNMAYLAIRSAGAVNGVSQLHGVVSRELFASLFPRWPVTEVPVGAVTNGVHVPTWDSAAADALWTKRCGQARWLEGMPKVEPDFLKATDAELWQLRSGGRQHLVQWTRQRLARQLAATGASSREVGEAEQVFDPDVLTIGFARRFATYKRPNLLLRDPHRLIRILTNAKMPVQIVVAGKAHPQDEPGKALVREWVQFARDPAVARHVAFIADYDMSVTENLVQGVDLWLNNPRRPWEACGTSGMKVLVNGGLNFSELDGWWAEAYRPEVGWALGDGKEHGEDPAWDAAEADALYRLLEDEVVPLFYTRSTDGIPAGWVAKMRASMAHLTPQFSTNRAVREYTEKHYLPAAAAYALRAADKGKLGAEILRWSRALALRWGTLRFGDVRVNTAKNRHRFDIHVYLGEVDVDSVSVELYAESPDGGTPVRVPLTRGARLTGTSNGFVFSGEVSVDRSPNDYTARVVPAHPAALVPLEAAQILWER